MTSEAARLNALQRHRRDRVARTRSWPVAGCLLPVACFFALLFSTATAAADEPQPAPAPPPAPAASSSPGKTASLGWTRLEGAEGCIATRELAESVEKILRRQALVSAAQADLAIEGRVQRAASGPGFVAVINVADPTGKQLGTRELATDQADCHALDEPVALAIALMIDPNASLAPAPDVKKEEKKEAVKTKEVVKEKKVYVPVRTPAPDPWRGDVFAGFSLGFGWLPNVSPGAHVGASLTPPWLFPMEVTARFFAPQTEDVVRGATVLFYGFQGAGFACPLRHAGSIGEIRACAGVEGGFLVAEGEGFESEPAEASPLQGQFGFSIKGRADFKIVGPFRLGLAPGITVPVFRPELVYVDDRGGDVLIFQQAPVAGTIDVFAMLAFP